VGVKTGYQLSVSLNDDILEIVVKGEIAKADVNQLHADIVALIMGKDARAVLCDIRSLKGRFDEVGEAYFRVRSFPAGLRNLNFEVVDASSNEPYKSFYNTTAANAGQDMHWFPDIESARAWLKSRLK
jgi:hypothetical protein